MLVDSLQKQEESRDPPPWFLKASPGIRGLGSRKGRSTNLRRSADEEAQQGNVRALPLVGSTVCARPMRPARFVDMSCRYLDRSPAGEYLTGVRYASR